MEDLKVLYKKSGTLHHAYCIEGLHDEIFPELCKFFEKDLKVKIKANPDFWHGEFETFSIEDGHFIKEHHTRQNLEEKQIFVISTRFMTHEAQNSLLKVFEEPTIDTHFFIITPSSDIFLPTLKSRLHIISKLSTKESSQSSFEIERYVKGSRKDRLEILEDIIEEKDKGEAINFLNQLESYLYNKKGNYENTLKQIIDMRSYLYDRSPSVKMILEHISLIVPQT